MSITLSHSRLNASISVSLEQLQQHCYSRLTVNNIYCGIDENK